MDFPRRFLLAVLCIVAQEIRFGERKTEEGSYFVSDDDPLWGARGRDAPNNGPGGIYVALGRLDTDRTRSSVGVFLYEKSRREFYLQDRKTNFLFFHGGPGNWKKVSIVGKAPFLLQLESR